jgi:predicted lipoprotein with Yx(FWY)xxD motif
MRSTTRRFLSGLAVAGLLSVASLAVAAPAFRQGLLTDPKGITLYTFGNEVAGSGESLCTGVCSANWFAYLAAKGDKAKAGSDIGIIVRTDGQAQWAFKGMLLYRFYDDRKPGDAKGDGLRGVWKAVRP